MIIFKYDQTENKLESGYYVVEVNSVRTIAEYYSDIDTWNQTGVDYDVWRYSKETQIKVIAKIDPDNLWDIKEIK